MNTADSRFALAVSLYLLAGEGSVQADFLQPVAVKASNNAWSEANGGTGDQTNLINGLGWINDTNAPVGSPYSVHSTSLLDSWFAIGSPKESLTFDLGQTVGLDKVYVWNFNAALDWGFKDVEVLVSPETSLAAATNFNAIAAITLQAGGTNAQTFDVVGTGVRLVRLQGLSNWGSGFAVGLAEARFGSGAIAGHMPWVTLTSPQNGDELGHGTNTPGADLLVDVTVTDPDGAGDIQMVQYFDGAVLVTNRTAPPYSLVLPGLTNGWHTVRVVATDQSGKVAWMSANVFVRTVYADRVVRIDDNADIGTNLNQIQYTGGWNLAQGGAADPRYQHNDHYNNGIPDDYFEVRFKGVKIEAYATVAAHHGAAAASIDGGAETTVNYYAPQRGEQVFVYGSPVLADGEHVLRVRVLGPGVVTADRFDVHVVDANLVATGIARVNDTVVLDFNSPNPAGLHELWESTNLVDWQLVPAAMVTQTGTQTVRITSSGATGQQSFYRAVLRQ